MKIFEFTASNNRGSWETYLVIAESKKAAIEKLKEDETQPFPSVARSWQQMKCVEHEITPKVLFSFIY